MTADRETTDAQPRTTQLSAEERELCSGVDLAVIGGSGLYHLPGFQVLGSVKVATPWGMPSSAITIMRVEDNTGGPNITKVAFLARHGVGHVLSPSEVPYQANIAALKHIGVKAIVAFSAVGSLQQRVEPTHFALPSQLIDRTKGIRKSTFLEKGVVGHVGLAEPFFAPLAKVIGACASDAGVTMHRDVGLVCMEGPAFSTRAESELYRQWGMDVINMSAVPECKLARESEIAYQMVCMATDYDCWRVEEEAVTVATVVETMEANAAAARRLLSAALPRVARVLRSGTAESTDAEVSADTALSTAVTALRGTTGRSVMTRRDLIPEEALNRLRFILPDDF